jgi:transcriptional regulator GlxA family with amidase domain
MLNRVNTTGGQMGFLLLPGFAMTSFSLAVEALYSANQLSGATLYDWRLYSPDGAAVQASNGTPIMPHEALGPTAWPQLVLVCASLGAQQPNDARVLAWLKDQARRGVGLGALSSGSRVLARAGLLKGYRCTIHWEDLPGFREEYPAIQVTDRVFEIDRNRYTCSGGTAALDMMLHIIATDHGKELAAAISDLFVQERARSSSDLQRIGRQVRHQTKSPKLDAAISLMDANVEAPLALSEIASRINVTPRHLERLFEKHCACSPRRYYRMLRLGHARLLLVRTGMSILDIALAAGFLSPSHFTKCYREHFGRTPTEERRCAI